MAEWMFDRYGRPVVIVDDDRFRSVRGQVIGWSRGDNVYSLRGIHIGWYEFGVLYDSHNRVLGFIRSASGLPGRPAIVADPGLPDFSEVPGRSGLDGAPERPGRGGWSNSDLATYFE